MKKGFTLFELMIVVVIIGIFAAVVIPKFNEIQEQEQAETLIRGTVTSYTHDTISISPGPGAIAEVYRIRSTWDIVVYAEIQATAVGDSIVSYEILKEE